MNNFLKGLFEKIEAIHDDHDVEPDVTEKIKEAIQEHYEHNDSDKDVVLQRLADHLANGRIAEATQLAVLTCKNDPEKAAQVPETGEDIH